MFKHSTDGTGGVSISLRVLDRRGQSLRSWGHYLYSWSGTKRSNPRLGLDFDYDTLRARADT